MTTTNPPSTDTPEEEMRKKHFCRFNDGEQKCDCFIAGMEAMRFERDKWKEDAERMFEGLNDVRDAYDPYSSVRCDLYMDRYAEQALSSLHFPPKP